MTWILTHHEKLAVTLQHLAIFTSWSNTCFDFHKFFILLRLLHLQCRVPIELLPLLASALILLNGT